MESAVKVSSLTLSVKELSPLQNFGEMLTFLRQKRSLTENDIAIRTGLPTRTIIAVETGKAPLEEVVYALPALSTAVEVQYRILSEALFDFGLVKLEE